MSQPTGPKTYSSTFPATPPDDLNAPDVIAAHDQQAFHELDEMLRHWDRPHKPSYHWLVPVGDEPAAIDLAARCQRYLPGTGLDLIPGPWIHLTVKRAGYKDEISAADIDELVATTAEGVRQVKQFDLQLIPLAGSPGALRLSVAPWEPLMELFNAARAQDKALDREPSAVFRPHVGIAYSSAQQSPLPMQEAARHATQELSPVRVEVNRLTLVAMHRADGWYEWKELHSIPLG